MFVCVVCCVCGGGGVCGLLLVHYVKSFVFVACFCVSLCVCGSVYDVSRGVV